MVSLMIFLMQLLLYADQKEIVLNMRMKYCLRMTFSFG